MSHRIAFFLILLLTSYIAYGQTLDREYVIDQNRKAADLNREGHFKKANNILDELLRRLEDENADDRFFASTFQNKAKVVQNLGQYEESSMLARKSLSISLKLHDSLNIADSYNTIGVNHYFSADYDSTTYYYEKSLQIKKGVKTDAYNLAVSTYNLALVYDDIGQTERAMELYKESEIELLRSGQSKNFLSDVYVGMALIYFYSEDISKAELYAEKAMEKGLISYGEFNPNMTFVYTTYANILEAEGKYNESVALLEKNLKIRITTYGEYHRWTCETYYDLANAYKLQKNYDKAERFYKKAIEIAKKVNSRQYLSYARNFLAQLYVDREIHLDEAENLLQLSLATNIDIYGPLSDLVGENYFQLAILYKLKGEKSKFFDYTQKVMKAVNYDREDLGRVIGPFQAMSVLLLLSDWYNEEYVREGNSEFLIESFKLIDQKTALIKHAQRNFSSDRSRIDFANKFREVFEKDLGLCWLLYQETKDVKYLHKAFELSETNRNTTLLKGLQGIKYRAHGDIPESKLALEQSIIKSLEKVKMDIFFEKSASKPDKEYYKYLLDERIELTNRLDSIYAEFHRNYPNFTNFHADNSLIAVEDVQNNLDEDTQLITYFLGDQSLFSFTITNDSIRLLRADIAKNLTEITNDFKNHLSKREDINELSHDLFLYLLGQQMDHDKSNMVIVADNVLNYIPFEVLKGPDGAFLVEHYNISYAGSVRLLNELNNEFFDYDAPNDWLGFAPTYRTDDGIELLSAKNEIEEIASLTKGEKFIGKTANKENFFLNNKNYSVLHFAMHAKIDNQNPHYNRMIFEDEELTASEIYTSNSRANMAVLSACNTGFGKIEKGEGVMSMARAFHFSGIPAILMSLWKVPDQETKTIMVGFYRNLSKGKSKSEALRLSKLKYLKSNANTELNHPYYWSGFVMYGNISPLKIGSHIHTLWWFVMAFTLVFIAGYVFKKLKN